MSDGARGRILVVEDVKQLGDVYRIFLQRAGFTAEVVKSKLAAINALREKIYDIALVDLHLEGEDASSPGGMEVMDEINHLGDGTRKIVVSGTTDFRETIESFRKRMDAFVSKGNFDSAEIIAAVDKVLDGHKRCMYGRYENLEQYLAAPGFATDLQNSLHGSFQWRYPDIRDISFKWLDQYAPLLRLKDGSPSFKLDYATNGCTGLFWSKEIGGAIWISLGRADALPEPTPFATNAELIAEHSNKGITARIWKVGAQRSIFLERIIDLPGQRPRE